MLERVSLGMSPHLGTSSQVALWTKHDVLDMFWILRVTPSITSLLSVLWPVAVDCRLHHISECFSCLPHFASLCLVGNMLTDTLCFGLQCHSELAIVDLHGLNMAEHNAAVLPCDWHLYFKERLPAESTVEIDCYGRIWDMRSHQGPWWDPMLKSNEIWNAIRIYSYHNLKVAP